MWATRSLPSQQFVLYSTTATMWATPQATPPITVSGFGLAATSAAAMAVSGSTSVYQYLPTGPRAFVVPLTCVALDATAVSVLSVTNGGAFLPDGGTAFLGDTLTVAPAVLPSPAIKPLSDWRFDFDFHPGSAAEDNVSPLPRIRNLDNAQLGNPAAPPAAVTLVGPCDPQTGAIPATGAGCWTSVRTNASVGGPDFTGAEPAGTVKPLKIALEATNQYGIQNTAIFTVNWKVPAVSVASNQLFLGQALVSTSEGQPLPTGFKWWFGDGSTSLTPAACNTASCVPTLDTKGTHYYWLTATYPNGYVSPDYNGTTIVGRPYTVIDFAPAFSVNGSVAGPISIDVGLNLQIGNSSMHSPGVTGAYSYSLCQIPGGQTTCSSAYGTLAGMTDPPTGGTPPTYANLPVPATAGSYLFRIRVDYTGGTAYWPDPSGVNGFPITVTAPTPEMHIFVNGYDPCGPNRLHREPRQRARGRRAQGVLVRQRLPGLRGRHADVGLLARRVPADRQRERRHVLVRGSRDVRPRADAERDPLRVPGFGRDPAAAAPHRDGHGDADSRLRRKPRAVRVLGDRRDRTLHVRVVRDGRRGRLRIALRPRPRPLRLVRGDVHGERPGHAPDGTELRHRERDAAAGSGRPVLPLRPHPLPRRSTRGAPRGRGAVPRSSAPGRPTASSR